LVYLEDPEDDSYTDHVEARQLLIDFMKHNKLKKFTLTQ